MCAQIFRGSQIDFFLHDSTLFPHRTRAFLPSYDPLLCEQLLTLTNPKGNSILNATLMKFYLQTRTCDSVVDYQLILSVIHHVCRGRSGK